MGSQKRLIVAGIAALFVFSNVSYSSSQQTGKAGGEKTSATPANGKPNKPGGSDNKGKATRSADNSQKASDQNSDRNRTHANNDAQTEGVAMGEGNGNEQKVQTSPSPSPSPSPTPTGNADAGIVGTILGVLPYLGGLLLIGATATGLFFFARRRKAYREWLEAELSGIRNKQNKMRSEIDDVKQITNVLNGHFQTQRSDIEKLDRAVAGQARMISQQPIYAEPQPQAPDYGNIPLPVVESKFPATVEDFLAKYGQSAILVAYDYKENLLVTDPNGEGNLVVVRDGSRDYLIPSLKLLSTKNLYDQYFEAYYACSNPRGGTIVVIEPAIVSAVSGGWKLEKLGELEFR